MKGGHFSGPVNCAFCGSLATKFFQEDFEKEQRVLHLCDFHFDELWMILKEVKE
jgi:hypothetical protein